MKKLLWSSAMALAAVVCFTACDESASEASNSVPTYKTEAALPDTCEMEVAKAGDAYFACVDNKWVEVTDSATVEKIKEGLDETKIKEMLEELDDLLVKPSSSSKKVGSSDSQGGAEPESSASEDECTGRHCKTGNSSSSKKSSGGSGNGGSGSGEGNSTGSSTGGSSSSAESSDESAGSSSIINYSSSQNKVESSGSFIESSGAVSSSGNAVSDRDPYFSFLDEYVYWRDSRSAALIDVDDLDDVRQLFVDNGLDFADISATNAKSYNELLVGKYGVVTNVGEGLLVAYGTTMTIDDSTMHYMVGYPSGVGCDFYTEMLPVGLCGTELYGKKVLYCNDGALVTLYEAVNIAVQANKVTMLQELADAGVPFEVRNSDGYYPIHLAVIAGSYEATLFLIEQGVDLNVTDLENQYSPLDYAVDNGYTRIIKALKTAGAKQTAKYLKEHKS